MATLGIPESLGVLRDFAKHTITVSYNDFESVEKVFKKDGENIACVIVEPVAGNMGVVLPEAGFLEGLREITQRYGALLIFDEVISGFRVALGGFQELCGIKPDMTILGKILGGGLPIGAYGGKKEMMGKVAPLGNVYQAGTLSGNPLSIEAGIATISELKKPGVYSKLEKISYELTLGLSQVAKRNRIECVINRMGSMWTLFFSKKKVKDYASCVLSETKKYAKFFRGMLRMGVYLAPSQFETCFLSLAHTESDIKFTINAAEKVFSEFK